MRRDAGAPRGLADPLDELAPDGIEPDGPGWQKLKSSQTRVAILEAAIDCLVEHGYAGLSLETIVKRAALSRGSLVYHFGNKQELVGAVIDYAFYRRMEVYTARIRSLSENERVARNRGIEVVWDIYTGREYTAYLQLCMGAWADRELHDLFVPRARRYDRLAREQTRAIFPEWTDHRQFDLASDLIAALLDGLILNREIWDAPNRARSIRGLAAMVVSMVREGSLAFPPLR